MNIKEKKIKSQYILFDKALVDDIDDTVFDPDYLQKQDMITGQAQGRGTTWFFTHGQHHLVLRHYRRGGFISNLSKDRYIWTGLNQTRAWQEWHLLAKLSQSGLPVPQPFAARIIHRGLFYTADIITVLIQDVITLANTLQQRKLGITGWENIGKCILQLHNSGLYHADLNAHNILLTSKNAAYVTDLDKGRILPLRHQWQQNNLKRLHRSLRKLTADDKDFHFTEEDWSVLVASYMENQC